MISTLWLVVQFVLWLLPFFAPLMWRGAWLAGCVF
jgi:hypothetical protein